jgi:hypothetical protein
MSGDAAAYTTMGQIPRAFFRCAGHRRRPDQVGDGWTMIPLGHRTTKGVVALTNGRDAAHRDLPI